MQYSLKNRDYLRCDVCGRYVPTYSMYRVLLLPDSLFGDEEYETLCFKHYTEKIKR
jgi:hypothetical protein